MTVTKWTTGSRDGKVAEAVRRWTRLQQNYLDLALEGCESEIERLLGISMMVPHSGPDGEPQWALFSASVELSFEVERRVPFDAIGCSRSEWYWVGAAMFGDTMCHLFSQMGAHASGHDYRLDFAIISESIGSKNIRIAIETDGHDFHERTKEQAARDKRRDRDLTIAGWQILRFTGSEVWADAGKCVEQVRRLLESV